MSALTCVMNMLAPSMNSARGVGGTTRTGEPETQHRLATTRRADACTPTKKKTTLIAQANTIHRTTITPLLIVSGVATSTMEAA